MQAEEILEHLGQKYAQCKSYADMGIVHFNDAHHRREQSNFRTLFSRPDYLSFEWQDYGPNRGKSEDYSVLWSKGRNILVSFRWGVERYSDLGLAIAGATGCSAGAASVIPNLLRLEFPEGFRHLLQMQDLYLLRKESFEDTPCFVINGTVITKHDRIAWVSEDDYSLRRMLFRRDGIESNLEDLLAFPESNWGDTFGFSDYRFSNLRFDEPIVELPAPIEAS